jgi:hypothetical protein
VNEKREPVPSDAFFKLFVEIDGKTRNIRSCIWGAQNRKNLDPNLYTRLALLSRAYLTSCLINQLLGRGMREEELLEELRLKLLAACQMRGVVRRYQNGSFNK